MDINLLALTSDDREQFILDNQEAFIFGALEEFGRRDDHFEEEGEIISRETIEHSIDHGEAYRIMLDDQPVGGAYAGHRRNLCQRDHPEHPGHSRRLRHFGRGRRLPAADPDGLLHVWHQ